MSAAVTEEAPKGLSPRLRASVSWRRVGTNGLLAALYLLFAIANLEAWRSTRHPVGLGTMVVELIVAVLFFIRRDPWVTSRAPLAWAATGIGTFGLLAARPAYAPVLGAEPVYLALQLLGAVGAAWSLGVLGRSFGLVPANRGVRTRGPYRIVRHPAYASYFAAYLGYTLENPSPWNAFLFAAVIACQLVRIRTEEDCLRGDPAYVQYCGRVRYRLVPYVW
jgi:protein-S-isoprenylcysteine O-methyltransferase Ste14